MKHSHSDSHWGSLLENIMKTEDETNNNWREEFYLVVGSRRLNKMNTDLVYTIKVLFWLRILPIREGNGEIFPKDAQKVYKHIYNFCPKNKAICPLANECRKQSYCIVEYTNILSEWKKICGQRRKDRDTEDRAWEKISDEQTLVDREFIWEE